MLQDNVKSQPVRHNDPRTAYRWKLIDRTRGQPHTEARSRRMRAASLSCLTRRKMTRPELRLSPPSPRVGHSGPIDVAQSTQGSAAVAINVVAQGTVDMASRADIVDLLMPAGIMEIPPCLLDPKVANLTTNNSIPVLLMARSICQAVIAQTQIDRHPGFQLCHQVRNVENAFRKEPSVLRRGG